MDTMIIRGLAGRHMLELAGIVAHHNMSDVINAILETYNATHLECSLGSISDALGLMGDNVGKAQAEWLTKVMERLTRQFPKLIVTVGYRD